MRSSCGAEGTDLDDTSIHLSFQDIDTPHHLWNALRSACSAIYQLYCLPTNLYYFKICFKLTMYFVACAQHTF